MMCYITQINYNICNTLEGMTKVGISIHKYTFVQYAQILNIKTGVTINKIIF